MAQVVDTVISGAKKVAEDVITFATTPMGPFEAVDKIVRDVRTTARSVVESFGFRVPAARGQIIRFKPLEELRRRIRILG